MLGPRLLACQLSKFGCICLLILEIHFKRLVGLDYPSMTSSMLSGIAARLFFLYRGTLLLWMCIIGSQVSSFGL